MAPPPRPDRPLLTRTLSALALLPPVLAAVYVGPPASDLLVIAAALLLCWEWSRLVTGRFDALGSLAMTLAVLAACVVAAASLYLWALAVLAAGALATWCLEGFRRTFWLPLGVLYLGLPCLAIIWLRHRPADGLEVLVWLLVVVWAMDIFAYLVGRSLGGPKLWPSVSPKKTWSGLLGGMLAAAVLGALGALWLPGWSWVWLAPAAAVLAAIAQGGDLFESAIKRRFGAKDASSLIPGHGGLLDRVDGLMAASLALTLTLWLMKY